MHITKLGHSCLLVEENNTRILIDPGTWSTLPEDLQNIDAILITHEHADHLDINWLQKILPHNPQAVIYTNKGVGQKLKEANINFQILEDGQSASVNGVTIEAFGKDHAVIYAGLQHWDNTGYLIGGRLFHPGDSLFVPSKPVEILALPVCAPWSKISEVIDYAKVIKPRLVFPIHDGMLKVVGPFHKMPETSLAPEGIEWRVVENSESILI